jgi:hypothetical protein
LMRLSRPKATKATVTPPAANPADCHLPTVGMPVRLRLGISADGDDGMVVEVPSVVRGVEDPYAGDPPIAFHFLIDAADVSFLPTAPAPGSEHVLSWTTIDAMMDAPVLLAQARRPAWQVVLAGAPHRIQRRQFVRVETRAATVVIMSSAEGPFECQAMILDFGEGGACCTIEGDPPEEDSRVTVILTGEEERLECPGIVVRHVPLAVGSNEVALAVRFDNPELHGDAIRRMVFAEQMRIRQGRVGDE